VSDGILRACAAEAPTLTIDKARKRAVEYLEGIRSFANVVVVKFVLFTTELKKQCVFRIVGYVLLKVFRRMFAAVVVDQRSIELIRQTHHNVNHFHNLFL
jgi:hypothetical protein